ncbi:MAG TPA: hypothetical protein VF607_16990 [Verrucomicrobiae bacterium]
MNFNLRQLYVVAGLVVLWRVCLLIFLAQPIPANDAAFFDTAMVNWYQHGHYVNPGLSVVFPISGHQVYAAYPPLYQVALLVWMKFFGTSVLSAMALHVTMFSVSVLLLVQIIRRFFPTQSRYGVVPLLLLAMTFDDRPEGLAHIFGLAGLWVVGTFLQSGFRWQLAVGLVLALLATLYTSVIVAALYFGTGFLALAAGWWTRRDHRFFIPHFVAAGLFVILTATIAKVEPLWWAGFQENARQTPVLTTGFRIPNGLELIKLIRTAPVFLLALAAVPLLWRHRDRLRGEGSAWLALTFGIFAMGVVLLVADMTLLAANYVGYVLGLQVLLAAGLIALADKAVGQRFKWSTWILVALVALISVRALGLSTWGVVCAWKNSYPTSQQVLRSEFAPYTTNGAPVVVASAYLYTAVAAGVQNPVHADWYYDRANPDPNANIDGLIKLRPAKLVLVQFDYYRAFVPVLDRLKQLHPEVKQTVRDFTGVRVPDSIPALQRVLQHITWAPVVVDLDWSALSAGPGEIKS